MMDSCRNTNSQLKKDSFFLLLITTVYSSSTISQLKSNTWDDIQTWAFDVELPPYLPCKCSKQCKVTGPNQLVWIMIALTFLKSTEILSLLWISH